MNNKFSKINNYGQVPKNCIHFTWAGRKHCWVDGDYDTNACNCKVLSNKFCEIYKEGIG